MSKTFEVYRANNPRLHNLLNQGDQYKGYLKRIQQIVQKKPMQDTSSKFYMTFLNRTKYVSRHHQSIEKQSVIGLQNRHLLDKIVKAKNRKSPKNQSSFSLAMYQKRFRQQQKINQENKQIAKRITEQYSLLKKRNNLSLNRSLSNSPQKPSPRKNGQSWHFQHLKTRKLPKLVNIRA